MAPVRHTVSVTIVTYNSIPLIEKCLESLDRQTLAPYEIIIVDNDSTDGTRQWLESHAGQARKFYNNQNVGFAAAQNQAIQVSGGEWVLTLNPDVALGEKFLENLLLAESLNPSVGSLCGKLLRANPDLSPLEERRIDSAGIYFTPNFRHFDRGFNEPDAESFDKEEAVFGPCAAAALYRRAMIDDISCSDGFFDPDFFTYREDADVAWRARLQGWECLYVPGAVGHHVRRVIERKRRTASPLLRMHSVKNRFLMRIKNVTPELYRHCWMPATVRDLVVLGSCLTVEWSSLPAFWQVMRMLRGARSKRRLIQSRLHSSGRDLSAWFQNGQRVQRKPESAQASESGRLTAISRPSR